MFRVRAANIRRSSETDRRRVFALALLLGASACHAAPRPAVAVSPSLGAVLRLQSDIQAILASPALDRSYWGVLVRSLAKDETIYSQNAGRLLMPGSTMKIVTLAAAAERLGWDYAFETRLMATGPVASGTLDGDLVAVGSGDPSITSTNAAQLFASVADRLKSLGVHVVTGRVIGDDDAFDDEMHGPGWAWDDLAGRDAAPLSGLQYNENTVEALVTPGAAIGLDATVTVSPASGAPFLRNLVATEAPGAAAPLRARRSPADNVVELDGSIPIGDAPASRLIAVDNPTLFFAAALREALADAGIEVRGPAADVDDLAEKPSVTGATLLLTHRSPPLSELAKRMMKNSQNLYAETLFKALGASAGMPSFEGGRTVTAETIAAWGILPTGLVQVDGSGLSRYNYVTAETLVGVLTHVGRDERDEPSSAPFRESLPIAFRDGTLATRMGGTAAEGNARAKSGTLANVRSLAGYVTTIDGEDLVFAITANNFGTMPEVAIAAIDAIVVRLAEFRR
jgi:D-alanyl-D-alanine carboxypeptidase/D-alanyl-D-alanine-endopeptidase (penicillin-binding protein 4)